MDQPHDQASLLRQALTDPDIRKSRSALQALQQGQGLQAETRASALTSALTHVDPLIRLRAVQALVFLGGANLHAAPLVACLDDRSWPVREAAAQGLGNPTLASPALREVLVRVALHDPQALVRTAAARSLAKHTEQAALAVETFREALRHPHTNVRRRAAVALAEFPDRAAEFLPDLRRALHESHWRVREAAALALGRLGPTAAAAVGDLMRRAGDGNPRVRKAADAALDQIAPTLSANLQDWLGLLRESEGFKTVWSHWHLWPVAIAHILERRFRWHCQHSGQNPDEVAQAEREPVTWAGRAAERHAPEQRDPTQVRAAAEKQELLWLSARLFELLQQQDTTA